MLLRLLKGGFQIKGNLKGMIKYEIVIKKISSKELKKIRVLTE